MNKLGRKKQKINDVRIPQMTSYASTGNEECNEKKD